MRNTRLFTISHGTLGPMSGTCPPWTYQLSDIPKPHGHTHPPTYPPPGHTPKKGPGTRDTIPRKDMGPEIPLPGEHTVTVKNYLPATSFAGRKNSCVLVTMVIKIRLFSPNDYFHVYEV